LLRTPLLALSLEHSCHPFLLRHGAVHLRRTIYACGWLRFACLLLS
jgi:hypothetical protein